MISGAFYGILILGMCVQKLVKNLFFLTAVAFFGSCGAMDTIIPSAGTYKVNAKIDGVLLDEFSFVGADAKIQPFFEVPVSEDPDVTALVVFLRDSKGEIAGWKVIYSLDPAAAADAPKAAPEKEKDQGEAEIQENTENTIAEEKVDMTEAENGEENENSENKNTGEAAVSEVSTAGEYDLSTEPYKNGDELVIAVKTLDKSLPFFPIPADLPMGRYTLVSHVMGEKAVLEKSEKALFYLGDAVFSFDGILVHQPGVVLAPSQHISKSTVVLLEAGLEFDNRLDPYIVWYNGRRIVSEGNYSDGAGNLLWKAPEQSGFFSLRVEVFPVMNRMGLAGYQKDVSLLVSSKKTELHLLSEEHPDLLHWYLFEGDLNDSNKLSPEYALKTAEKIQPKWMPANGVYGLAAGPESYYQLPFVPLLDNGAERNCIENWQIFLRLKPLNDGGIFSVRFGSSPDVMINLHTENKKLILTLSSSAGAVSQSYALPETDSLLTADLTFSISPDRLSAKLNIDGNENAQNEAAQSVSIEAVVEDGFTVTLGRQMKDSSSSMATASASSTETAAARGNLRARKQVFTAIWDEFALVSLPPEEIIIEDDALEADEILLAEDDNSGTLN